MKNIHILPTGKPSRLRQNKITKKYSLSYGFIDLTSYTPVNIYITSDVEDINENDYIITKDGRLVQVSYLLSKDVYSASKVVLTTDQDLIKDGVQAIDDEFLEWFVKNPSCEYVSVEYNEYEMFGNKSKKWIDSHNSYEIIVPKEEPTTCECGANTSCQCGPEETSDSIEIDYSKVIKVQPRMVRESFPKEEPKQETLEKYIEREFQFNSSTVIQNQEYVYLMNKNRFKIAVNNILKYQKEQDKKTYSEEEVRKISLDFFYHWWNDKGSNTEQGFDKWFEQVKK